MAFELKDGQGTFFKNDKEGNEKRPDYRGELNVGGTIYRISGWIKEGQKGKWMSLSCEAKDKTEGNDGGRKPAARTREDW
jgi:hypothetical protein